MKRTEIKFNFDGLDDIKRKVGKSMRARVGVLGNGAARQNDSGITNAELMLIHIFGSITRNIPPRDCLVMPIVRNRRELIRSLQTGAMRQAFEAGDYKKMFKILGIEAEILVQEAFDTGGFGTWPPLKQATIDAKGSDKILIDTAEMRKSVTSDVVTQGTS